MKWQLDLSGSLLPANQGPRHLIAAMVADPWKVAFAARGMVLARWGLRNATNVGELVRVDGRLKVLNIGTLLIGPRVRISSRPAVTELAVFGDGVLEIGESAFVNFGCSIAAVSSVRIGARCNIGTHVIIMDNEFHRLEPERRNEMPESRPIVLGENVWVGGRSIILPGVTIGEDSVVGAGSVVTRDVPPRTVVAGVPAKILRTL